MPLPGADSVAAETPNHGLGFAAALSRELAQPSGSHRDFLVFYVTNPVDSSDIDRRAYDDWDRGGRIGELTTAHVVQAAADLQSESFGFHAVAHGLPFGPFDTKRELLDCIDGWDFTQ